MYAHSLLDLAAEELKLAEVTDRRCDRVARETGTLLGHRFSSVTFMYVLMRAFELEFYAARDGSCWQEFHGGQHALSGADLEASLAPWLTR